MGTKNNPGQFDCYGNAEPDEPMFILLARDPAAPATLEKWIEYREGLIAVGLKPESDRAMLKEASNCADAMREWRSANRPPLPPASDLDKPRCEICDWPLSESADHGCVPGNCSYRPREGTAEHRRIQDRRAAVAAHGGR
jgi:hypothetical protein